jgi:hypothetical protein
VAFNDKNELGLTSGRKPSPNPLPVGEGDKNPFSIRLHAEGKQQPSSHSGQIHAKGELPRIAFLNKN